MFGNGKNLEFQFQTWQNLEFQCLKSQNFKFYYDWKRQTLDFQSLEKPKGRIPVFRKRQIYNSNVWKRQSLEFQGFEKAKI